ncbi:MAG TPA: HNH endonuclease signature motif containing protein [Acidimicrobiia bacterium]|nr:HNH endonuclease signature motif containing protein [Acidimicrobiia bacterium]
MFASNELSSTIDGYLGQQDESSAFDAVCQSLDEAIEGLDKFVAESDGISTDQIKKIVFLSEKMLFARDKASAQYEKGNAWSDDTFLSAKTAIMWESHIGIHQADKSIRRGELLNNYPVIEEAAKAGLITTDHITSLLRIADDDKYHDHFVSDIDQIIGNASVLPASQFSLVVTMWKHSINELLGESSIEYEAFKERYLDVYQTAEGYWIVDGKLDQMNGSLFHKALKDINNKNWRETDAEDQNELSVSQRNADSVGYLAQGYLTHTTPATSPHASNDGTDTPKEFSFSYTPALTADIVIDINDLDPEFTTQAFLRKAMNPDSPLIHAHSRQYLEQILCDTTIHVPVKQPDGTFDLGRSARTAPWRLKKQLMLSQKTCSAPGCTIPAHWCDAHHIHHWAHGGETNLDNLMLLCRRHHTIMHNDVFFEERLKQKEKPPPLLSSA